MIYTEFIDRFKSIPLSYEYYKKRGLEDDFIEQYLAGFNPPKRSNNIRPKERSDELIKLLTTYDLSCTSIGMIEFLPEIIENNDWIYFGKFEVDFLVLYKPLDEIRCYEKYTDRLLFSCAKNGEMFLSAIFEAATFLEKSSDNKKIYDDEGLADDVAVYCAELAGGNEYYAFYDVLLS